MDKTKRPQQLSFSFEEPVTRQTVVILTTAQAAVTQDSVTDDVKAIPAVVYDFRSAATKRKESTHASLYRQILDSVRHIG